jgi:N-acetylglucosamine kinase-like BadF-type ATPase
VTPGKRSAGPTARPSVVLAGADVGGMHTAVGVGRSADRILGRAEGTGAAVRPGAAAASAATIVEVVHRALAQAGLDTERVDAIVVGAAGVGRAAEQDELKTALTALKISERIAVMPDIELCLHAAFGGKPGIVVSAGTGSIACARTAEGKDVVHRAGGYGWQMGDEGSGYWIGREAMRAVGRSLDGRAPTTELAGRLFTALGLKDLGDLVRWAQTATVAQVAGLAAHVQQGALEGEPVAQAIVLVAAAELTFLVRALVERFPKEGEIQVAAVGGLLQVRSPLRHALAQSLATHMPRARLLDGPVDAVRGALALAARLAGV